MEVDETAPLREDVRKLGELLGNTISEQVGPKLLETIEEIRKLAKDVVNGNKKSNEALLKLLENLPADMILPVARAFTQFLNLANIAEQYHRIRRGHLHQMSDKEPQPGSLDSLLQVLKDHKISENDFFQIILQLKIDLVLTAHPTEVTRRTLIYKYDQISKMLESLDRIHLTAKEQKKLFLDLAREITAIWQTDEIRHAKPTPLDEARWGFAVIEHSIWDALPNVLRELDEVVFSYTHKNIPLHLAPITFGTWMGGDRDGNPNVTPEVTKQVCFMARWAAADLYEREIKKLRDSLSMQKCNDVLREEVGDVLEPYRALLKIVLSRLEATKIWANQLYYQLAEDNTAIYLTKEELLKPLLMCYHSLVSIGAQSVANGHLLDVIRRVYCFGLTLVRLDIRQEAKKHAELMDALTRYLGLGSYLEWSELEKQQFLIQELNSRRPLIPENIPLTPELLAVLDTFRLLPKIPSDNLGAYVISMAKEPSDSLLVALFQQAVGMKKPLRVVPLFETLLDLDSSPRYLDALLSIPWYREYCKGEQEVMIGYSDPVKESGFFSATWAQYLAEEALMQVADQYQVRLTFFHGRGGSIGRGGSPTHIAILSQPPGTLFGQLRVTQQGEVIRTRFGTTALAERTLSLYVTSTVQGSIIKNEKPTPAWRALMNDLSRVSSAHHYQVVKDPNFYKYFQEATPFRELNRLAIGSRPQHRDKKENLESLRAIPWVFAWTQNRLLLPNWLGVGIALQYALDTGREDEIQSMIKNWPFFHALLALIEMILAKTEIEVTSFYDERLVDPELLPLGAAFRKELQDTKSVLLKIIGQSDLLTKNKTLQKSIQVRNPYLLPLSILQVELLCRIRNQKKQVDRFLEQALLVTIAGIAAGMRNTG